ncbi:MAG: HAMP domain-containing sensor histidine kinase, partial [Planctomycetota bacterium]
VISKAFFVGFCGWLMAQSVGKDYQKLSKTEQSLERTHGELQSFVYRTSHDFKSPLLGIKSMVRFIKDDIESGEKEEALSNVQRIEKNIDVLEAVVSSTLQLAKTDLAEERLEDIELDSLIGEVESRLKEFAQERNVSLQVSDQVANMAIKTDKQHLLAAIENLVSNGIKYSRENHQDAVVRIDASEDEGVLRLVIEDNGIGIPEEYQSQVFQMFKQFHSDRSEGTGLGMYIVKRSVERLQGEVSLESSKDGTRTTILLPVAPTTQEQLTRRSSDA